MSKQSKFRIETQNLWKNWKPIWRNFEMVFPPSILGIHFFSIYIARDWIVITLFNFSLDIEWFPVFLDKDGEAWPWKWEEETDD